MAIEIAPTPEAIQLADKTIKDYIGMYEQAAADYEKRMIVPEGRGAFGDVQTLMQQYLQIDQQVHALVGQGRQTEAIALTRGQADPVLRHGRPPPLH